MDRWRQAPGQFESFVALVSPEFRILQHIDDRQQGTILYSIAADRLKSFVPRYISINDNCKIYRRSLADEFFVNNSILKNLISGLLTSYVFGSKVLKLSPVLLFGALAGALTSGAALSIVTREAKSSAPALGYTGTYAFANIILSMAGTLMVLL